MVGILAFLRLNGNLRIERGNENKLDFFEAVLLAKIGEKLKKNDIYRQQVFGNTSKRQQKRLQQRKYILGSILMNIVLFDIFFLRVVDAFMDETHPGENSIRLCRVGINNPASAIENVFCHLLDRIKIKTLDHLQENLAAAARPGNDARRIFFVVSSARPFLLASFACVWVEILASRVFLALFAGSLIDFVYFNDSKKLAPNFVK